jgi:nicotinate-nucleotide adenylyltransferase
MKLGIFGGTFNPPHLGHLIVAESVRDQLRMERIFFIPSSTPPNKRDGTVAPGTDRLAMTQLAIKGNDSFEVSDIELSRGGVSYSVDTLAALAERYAKAKLHLIIGADNLIEFETWKSPDRILAKAELVVVTRPGFEPDERHGLFARRAIFVKIPQIAISGTDVRRRLKMGRSIRYLVPEKVEEYILRTGLYR